MALAISRFRPSACATGWRLGRGIFLVSLVLGFGSTEGLFNRHRKKGSSRAKEGQQPGGKGKGAKKGKVKEDVAWLLEDTSEGAWKPVKDDGHVQVWKRSMPNSDFVAIKSKASLAVSPQALFEVLTPGDIEIVRQYNPLVEDGSDLEVIDRDNKVSWSTTMGVWPCRPRDFVTHIRRATLDDGSVAIVNSATTHPKAPAKGKYVRGEILHGVFHIKAAKHNKKHSEFTMVHHFNPGGNIPPWLINWLAEGKPAAFVKKLEEVAGKWDEQAALTKSMPCKGRGFADKPCAFLLSPTDGSQEADGLASGAGMAMAGRGWPPHIAILTMAALLCGGWLAWFGWPAPSEHKEPSPAAKSEGKGSKETNGTISGADATRALPATHEAPPRERPSSDRQEIGEEEVASEETVVERHVGESLSREAQGEEQPDVDSLNGEVPNGEVPNGEVPSGVGSSAEEEPGKEVPEPVGGEHASRKGEGTTSSSPPAATTARTSAAIAAEGEVPEGIGALPDPLSATQEEPGIATLGGKKTSKDSPKGQAACVEQNGGGSKDFSETEAQEANYAIGEPSIGVVGNAANKDGEATTAGDVVNGEVRDRNEFSGESIAARREFRENSLFLFGDKPFDNSMG